MHMGTGENPSEQNPPPAKNPLRQKKTSGQNPPPAKIPIWPKPPSDKKPPSGKKKKKTVNPPLSLINKYHPKLRLFYIKFRLS